MCAEVHVDARKKMAWNLCKYKNHHGFMKHEKLLFAFGMKTRRVSNSDTEGRYLSREKILGGRTRREQN